MADGASCLIGRCHVRYLRCRKSDTQVGDGLTLPLCCFQLYPRCGGTQAAALRIPWQFDCFLVQHGLAYLLPQSVIIRTSGHVLSLIYRFICGKTRTSTLMLACLFNTVRWVINHLYTIIYVDLV